MTRRVVRVLGSPRLQGNSAALSDAVCGAAATAGAEVVSFTLNFLDYRGCQACMACKGKREDCALTDGLTPVLAAVRGCDVLVLATPVYFGEVASQTKGFIDRCYSLLTPDYATNRAHRTRRTPGGTFCMVIAQGHPRADLFTDIFPRYAYFFNWLGFGKARLLRECGVFEPGAASARGGALERAAALGRDLALDQGEADWTPPIRG